MPSPEPRKDVVSTDPQDLKIDIKAFTSEFLKARQALLDRLTSNSPRYKPDLEADLSIMGEMGVETLPLYSQVGHLDLDPYVWLMTDNTEESTNIALRRGLTNITLTNEKAKYPKVEFDLIVPDFRDFSFETVVTEQMVSITARKKALDKFRVGLNFYVMWGYKSAHTKWGPFRVTERSIDFINGSVVLHVVGLMGARLKHTSTSEVFSSSYGKPAIDKVASLAGLSIDKRGLLESEYDRLLKPIVSAGHDAGQILYRTSTEADVDLFFDPEQNAMKLQTPFKLELVKRGAKPLNLTYGYPSSIISSIKVDTKSPRKRGTGPSGGHGVGDDGRTTPSSKTKVVEVLEKGAVFGVDEAGMKKVLFSIGKEPRPIYPIPLPPDERRGSISKTISATLAALRKEYPKSEGYRVESNYQGFWPTSNVTGVDGLDYLLYKKVTISKNLGPPKTENVTKEDLSKLIERAKARQIQLDIDTTLVVDGKLPVTYYEVLGNGTQPPQTQSGSSTETTATTTTTESVPSQDSASPEGYEYQEVERVVISQLEYQDPKLRKVYEKKVKDLEAKAAQDPDRYRVEQDQQIIEPTRFFLKSARLVIQVPVRRNPEDPTTSQESDSEGTPTAAPRPEEGNPKPSAKPKSITSGNSSVPSRTRDLSVLTINLKAGDWTMRVGRLIKINDLYKSIDGIYYIFKEEHSISNEGFNTTIECKRASAKQISSYGAVPKPKSLVKAGAVSVTTSTRQDATQADAIATQTALKTPLTQEESLRQGTRKFMNF